MLLNYMLIYFELTLIFKYVCLLIKFLFANNFSSLSALLFKPIQNFLANTLFEDI